MTGPKRVQRRRTKGWRMPEGAVYVGRPSKWGNPYVVVPEPNHPRWGGPRHSLVRDPNGELWTPTGDVAPVLGRAAAEAAHRRLAAEFAVELFTLGIDPAASPGILPPYPLIADMERELQGHDLACWCLLSSPCHADVLLELANPKAAA